MSLLKTQERIARLCLAEEPGDEDVEALGGPRQRWVVYRQLVRERWLALLQSALPRTTQALGRTDLERWVSRWLAASPPRTPFLRDVASEFLEYTIPLWRDTAATPAWLPDLATLELTCWQVGDVVVEWPEDIVEFDFDLVPVLNPTLQLLQLAYPVHLVRSQEQPYESTDTSLCIYRRPDSRVDRWALNEPAFALLSTWRTGSTTVTESVHHIANEHGLRLDEGFLRGLTDTLAGLFDSGILLGSTRILHARP